MKSQTVKTFLDVHSWTGLGAGIALFIAFYTGAITVFFHELEAWGARHTHQIDAPAQSREDAQLLINLALEKNPDANAFLSFYPAHDDHPEHSAVWYEQFEDGTYKRHDFALRNGELDTSRHESNAHLAGFIYRLHYTAGLPRDVGINVLGVVSLIYGLALVTGVLVFLPNFFKDLLIVRTGRNKKRFWRDAHNVVGIVSLPWHVMFAWSSVMLTIGIFLLAPFQLLVFEENLLEKMGAELGFVAPPEKTGQAAAMLSVSEILDIAEREIPGMEVTQIRYTNYGDENSMVSVFGDLGTDILDTNGSVNLLGASGEVLTVSDPRTASFGATFYNGLIALHFASFGGFTLKWVYFLLGLAGAFMFYTGNLLWVETRRKRRQFTQPKKAVLFARLNSGVCIGCMAGVSAAFLASLALAGMEQRSVFTEYAYYSVFFASVVWCFLRPVALGTRDLLRASAVLTALIPVFAAAYGQVPLQQSLSSGEWVNVCIDLLAIAGAVAFWQLARAVEVRSRSGDANSVWFDPPTVAEPVLADIEAAQGTHGR
ncbi:MAG: PepSY-associated TM helix domain-containing protein [Pseudomonadota bacterium]